MTKSQRTLISHIALLARTARRDLGGNAADGAKARPTVAQLNRTLAHLAAIEAEAGQALSGKPELCYVAVPDEPAGRRIGIVRRGEAGYHATTIDIAGASIEIVRAVVDDLNAGLGVDRIEHRAMVCGSMFGWNVPAANSDHAREAIAEAEAIAAAYQAPEAWFAIDSVTGERFGPYPDFDTAHDQNPVPAEHEFTVREASEAEGEPSVR